MFEITVGTTGGKGEVKASDVKNVRYAKIIAGKERNKLGTDAWSIIKNLEDGTEIRMGKFE